jgi:hypothetical protein
VTRRPVTRRPVTRKRGTQGLGPRAAGKDGAAGSRGGDAYVALSAAVTSLLPSRLLQVLAALLSLSPPLQLSLSLPFPLLLSLAKCRGAGILSKGKEGGGHRRIDKVPC